MNNTYLRPSMTLMVSKARVLAAVLPIMVGLLLHGRLAFLGLSPVSFDLPRPLPLPDPRSTTRLGEVAFDLIGKDSIVYPEALVKSPDGKFAFLSLGDGRIVRMTTKDTFEWRDLSWQTVVRTGEESEDCGSGGPSDENEIESICGRPLGMLVTRRSAIDPYYSSRSSADEDVLLVADSYKGLLMVTNIYRGDGAIRVLATRAVQDPSGYRFNLLNALVETPDGSIYITETSRKFQRRRIFYEAMNGRPSGRLLRYSKQRGGIVDVVAKDLYMANGLALSHDGKSLLIVSGVTIRRFDLALRRLDPKPFIDVMPGTGDNIRKMNVLPTGERRKCYWAGLGGKYAQPFSLLYYLSDKAWVRSAMLALVPYKKVIDLVPKWTALAIYDERGERIGMLLDDGKDKGGGPATVRVPWVSEVEPLGDYLYFLSWYNPFLARIKRIDIQP